MWEIPDLKREVGSCGGGGQKAFVILSGRIGGAAGSRNCDFHCYKNLIVSKKQLVRVKA